MTNQQIVDLWVSNDKALYDTVMTHSAKESKELLLLQVASEVEVGTMWYDLLYHAIDSTDFETIKKGLEE